MLDGCASIAQARDRRRSAVVAARGLASSTCLIRTCGDCSVRRARSEPGDRVDVALAHADRIADVYLHIVLPEAIWYHAPLLRDHAGKYSPGVRLRLEMGGYVLAEDYLRAMHARTVLRRAVDRALDGVDALLLPALPIGAPPLGASSVDIDGRPQPVRAVMLRLTQLFNITGHPAIAIPCGRGADGLPRAIQLVGADRRAGSGVALAVTRLQAGQLTR
jgi:Asp-tRNA(Asn)/Glu-tRNA(Gln) amidotransferase A subunit family amidase